MNEGPIYLTPNYVALNSGYNYHPIEKGMGFNVSLFSSLISAGVALTTTMVQTISQVQLLKRQETLEKRAERAERLALEEEEKKRAELAAKNEETRLLLEGGGQAPPTIGGGQVALPVVGAVSVTTLLLGGGLVVAAILLLRRRREH